VREGGMIRIHAAPCLYIITPVISTKKSPHIYIGEGRRTREKKEIYKYK
jgi:F0F1-type ATP synthase beta subunit